MATTGKAFAIALALYSAICLAILLAFSWWRQAPWSKRFYAPKSFTKGQPKPKSIRRANPFAWIGTTEEAPEPAIVRFAGVDGLMYLTILRFGLQLFLGITALVLLTALPINLTGGQVARLMATKDTPQPSSQFTYWVPGPQPTPTLGEGEEEEGSFSVQETQPKVLEQVQPPNFYVGGLPPAPAGLQWWEYAPDVPLLQQPAEVLGPNFTRYGWRYDAEVVYRFSDFDKTTMANIEAGSPRLYAHAVLAWVVSAYALALLYKFNKVALRLRIHHLLNSPPGAESHTVLLTDIPGVAYGTLPHRMDSTLLRFLPRSIKANLAGAAKQGVRGISSQLKLGASWAYGKAPARQAGQAVTSRAKSEEFDGPSSSRGGADFTIAAGRGAGIEDGELTLAPKAAELAWDQALRQLAGGATIQQVVDAQLRAVFGSDYQHVVLARDTTQLDPLVEEYTTVLRSAEDLMDHYLSLRRRNRDIKPVKLTVVPVQFGGWGLQRYGPAPVRVDALQHYRDRLVELRRVIVEEQEAALQRVTPSAFVTFKTRRAQVLASTSLVHHDMSAWRCHPAPGPGEVVWSNVGWRMWERRGRCLLMWAAFCALALFYMVPVAAVQSLLALNSLTAFFQEVPLLNALVTAVLPGLVLKIFLKLLPALLAFMVRSSGAVSESAVDMGVLRTFFIFQVITVFFGSFIAGSFANQIKQFVRDPGSVLTILGTAAPQTAIFFTTYLMLQALLAKPLSLLRLPGLVIFWLKHRLAATERAKARVWQDQEQTYGGLVPDDTMALLLGLVFCLICPIIAPMALVYFAVVHLVWKYQLLYVKKQRYQSGGQAWTRVFGQICFALVLFQATMVAILAIKRAVAPPLIVLPLLPITVGFWWWCHALFWRPQQTLALADAAQLDEEEQAGRQGEEAARGEHQWRDGSQDGGEQGPGGAAEAHRGGAEGSKGSKPASQLYMSPSFRLDLGAAFGALLYEADMMLAFLACPGGEGEGADLEALQLRQTATVEAAYVTAEEEAGGAPLSAQPSWLAPGLRHGGGGDSASSKEEGINGGERTSPAVAGEETGGHGHGHGQLPAGLVMMVHNPVAGSGGYPALHRRRSTADGGGAVAAAAGAGAGTMRAPSVDVELGGGSRSP